jgi:fluoroquinolone transport system permease protein
MFKTILKAELRNILRDRMYLFFAIYPVIFGIIGYFLADWIDKTYPSSIWDNITAMMMIIITGYVFGALIAFTLLDDKDDLVLMSLKVTPIDVKHYIYIKILVGMVFGFVATFILIVATDFLPDSSLWIWFAVSILGALQVPSVTLIVNSFSENKVEGFVIMKLSGIVLMFPVIGFLVTGWVQYLLGIAPGYWAGRIVEMELLPTEGGSALLIFTIGVCYNLLATWLLLKLYAKKSNL